MSLLSLGAMAEPGLLQVSFVPLEVTSDPSRDRASGICHPLEEDELLPWVEILKGRPSL